MAHGLWQHDHSPGKLQEAAMTKPMAESVKIEFLDYRCATAPTCAASSV